MLSNVLKMVEKIHMKMLRFYIVVVIFKVSYNCSKDAVNTIKIEVNFSACKLKWRNEIRESEIVEKMAFIAFER